MVRFSKILKGKCSNCEAENVEVHEVIIAGIKKLLCDKCIKTAEDRWSTWRSRL